MKIVIYGVSCAGKDTFINDFIKRFLNFSHIKGATRLNEISKKRYKCSFSDIDSKKQNQIRKEFILELNNVNEIIVDGHYSFPKEDSYEIVFTDDDKDLYDIFFYLRANSKIVKERILKSEKNTRFKDLTEEEIEKWQEKEISELRNICFNEQKDFIILDDKNDECFSFLEEYFSSYPNMNSLEIAKRIVEEIISSNCNNKKIALFDCDKTVVKEDTTIPFFEINNKPTKILKQIFCGDAYSIYQFWRLKNIYKKFSIYPELTKFNTNQEVLNKIESLKENGYIIYGLTAGIYKIWNDINNEYHFFYKVIGNNLMNKSVCIISDFVKGYIVKLLQKNEYTVFSTGDSMCDIYMLESSGGYVWASEKIKSSIQNYINEHKHTSIKQYKNNPIKYIGIEEA